VAWVRCPGGRFQRVPIPDVTVTPSTGKDRDAAGKVAGMFGWACGKCGAADFGTPPENGLCGPCEADDDRPESVPVPA
jgi:hypothetical protein